MIAFLHLKNEMPHTIVAQATASGLAGLSVIRVSGSEAFSIADKCFRGKKNISSAKTHSILYGTFVDGNRIIDEVTASIFHAPHSYTGENVVEFGAHGGTIIPMQIISTLIKEGCMPAQPGEFTKRAFVNGKLNLMQAEAVADLIHSISVPSANISARQIRNSVAYNLTKLRNKLMDIASVIELEMDFVDEGISLTNANNINAVVNETIEICSSLMNSYKSSSILREGFVVAIVGKPNAGKSTLFNALLNSNRAIVSEIPGTTRDYIAETIYINDIPIKLIDTAGLRDTNDVIEIQGIEYSLKILEEANLILLINDCAENNDYSVLHKNISEKFKEKEIIIVQNKVDLCSKKDVLYEQNMQNVYYISAKEPDEKLNTLQQYIGNVAKNMTEQSNDILLNDRQYYKLESINKTLHTVNLLIKQDAGNEIVAIEIRNVGNMLDELTGKTWNENVLNNVFSKFCIGK